MDGLFRSFRQSADNHGNRVEHKRAAAAFSSVSTVGINGSTEVLDPSATRRRHSLPFDNMSANFQMGVSLCQDVTSQNVSPAANLISGQTLSSEEVDDDGG